MTKKKTRRKVQKIKPHIPHLVAFTRLMEKHAELAPTMATARFANGILVTQFRGQQAYDQGVKTPREEFHFWVYAVKSGDRVNRSMIYKIKQELDKIAARFGQKISWKKPDLQVVEHGGEDYIVKGGVVKNVFALIPPEESRMRGLSSDYRRAHRKLKRDGVQLKEAKQSKG